MKKAALVLTALAFLFTAPGMVFAQDSAEVATEVAAEAAAEAQVLTGEFKWNRQDHPGALKAVFTPTGENTWDVAFHFDFRDEPHIYSGTAEGSLDKGSLKGKVMSDGDEPSPFTFEGEFVDGKFEGTHASTREEEPQDTGTLTLGR